MFTASEPKKGMYGLDLSKYPVRMGKRWDDTEVMKLLIAVKKGKTLVDIAASHERTQGSIVAKLCGLATDYHFNDKKSMEEITVITGLSRDMIEDAIQRRTYKQEIAEPTMKEVMAVLQDIQQKMAHILERIQ